jgi:hypothetical protein
MMLTRWKTTKALKVSKLTKMLLPDPRSLVLMLFEKDFERVETSIKVTHDIYDDVIFERSELRNRNDRPCK